jgi:hypothetical protein
MIGSPGRVAGVLNATVETNREGPGNLAERHIVGGGRTRAQEQNGWTMHEQISPKEMNAHFEASWEMLLNRQVEQARQILAKLFGGERVPFSPARSGYEFKGIASVGKLLIGHAKGLVSPIGM